MSEPWAIVIAAIVSFAAAYIGYLVASKREDKSKFNEVITERRIEWLRLLTEHFSAFITKYEILAERSFSYTTNRRKIQSIFLAPDKGETKDAINELIYHRNYCIALLSGKSEDAKLIKYMIDINPYVKPENSYKDIVREMTKLYKKIEKREWEEAKIEIRK